MDEENVNENSFEEIKVNKITSKNIIWMIFWLIFLIYIIYEVYILSMYTLGKKEKSKMCLYNFSNNIISAFVSKDTSQTEEYSVKFAGLGDIYFTSSRLKSIKGKNGYDFISGISNVSEKLKDYDIVVASLKTPIVNSSLGYSNNKTYGAPQGITEMLKTLNISLLATATSHSFDKGKSGIIQTIENLESDQIKQVGISSNEIRNNPVILSKNNISIGILSYTTNSNVKIPKDNQYMLNIFDEEHLEEDIKYLKSQNIDFIVSYLNIPDENVSIVNAEQKSITEKLFASGVNVVLGSGSMVVQEEVEEETEEGEHIYAIYSLGDFCGSFETKENFLNVIANIEFKKNVIKDKNGNIQYTHKSMLVKEKIAVWNSVDESHLNTMYLVEDEIKKYEDQNSNITTKEYNKMKEAQEKLINLFN